MHDNYSSLSQNFEEMTSQIVLMIQHQSKEALQEFSNTYNKET